MRPAVFATLAIFLLLLVIAGCAQGPEKTDSSQIPVQEQESPSAEAPPQDAPVHDFAINNMTISSIDWSVGRRVTIYPLVRNLGNSVSNLKVIIFANNDAIKTYSLDMKQGEVKQLMFDWYPESSGRYTISVVLDPENKFNDIHPENNRIEYSKQISEEPVQ